MRSASTYVLKVPEAELITSPDLLLEVVFCPWRRSGARWMSKPSPLLSHDLLVADEERSYSWLLFVFGCVWLRAPFLDCSWRHLITTPITMRHNNTAQATTTTTTTTTNPTLPARDPSPTGLVRFSATSMGVWCKRKVLGELPRAFVATMAILYSCPGLSPLMMK